MKKNCGCKIVIGTVYGDRDEFPFNRGGWGNAKRRAQEVSSGHKLAMVDIQCDGGRFPVYQCQKRHCTVEDFSAREGETSIAGASRRRKKR